MAHTLLALASSLHLAFHLCWCTTRLDHQLGSYVQFNVYHALSCTWPGSVPAVLAFFLDLFNEHGCFVHITVSINCYIFSKDNIEGIVWCKTKTSLKKRSLCRRVFSTIVRMLHITQMFIPKLRMLVAIALEQLDHCTVYHLCLTIYLWMKGCALLQSGVHQLP